MAALESLFYVDYSLSIKAGVHFTLCGGTICKLGTKKHHDAYLDRMDTLDLPGSFSMTELGELKLECLLCSNRFRDIPRGPRRTHNTPRALSSCLHPSVVHRFKHVRQATGPM